MSRRIDMVGEQCGQLCVIADAGSDKHGQGQWLCRCSCGRMTTVVGPDLRSGHTKSCGCLSVALVIERSTRHGGARRHAHTSEHRSWAHMKERCRNAECNDYANYGGRGIRVCERWESFENFLADMGPRPSAKHSIDRINNDGNYEPGNCRWATRCQQNSNQRMRRTNSSGVQGVHWYRPLGKWIAKIGGVPREERHLGYFANIEDAARAYSSARAERDCSY